HSHAVWMLGTLHGYVWLAFVLVVFLVRAEYRWDFRTTVIALASSVPPFVTVPFEIWATGQLRARRAADESLLRQGAEPAQDRAPGPEGDGRHGDVGRLGLLRGHDRAGVAARVGAVREEDDGSRRPGAAGARPLRIDQGQRGGQRVADGRAAGLAEVVEGRGDHGAIRGRRGGHLRTLGEPDHRHAGVGGQLVHQPEG